jgi:oxygen-independent coproporphyrinogen-3 oxidase
VRLSTADVLERYISGSPLQRIEVSYTAALEETFFLGLRLNRGIDLRAIAETFGQPPLDARQPAIDELVTNGLLQKTGDFLRLTPRGRLLSNEVFQASLAPSSAVIRI